MDSVPFSNEDIPTILDTLLNSTNFFICGLEGGKCVLLRLAVDLCSDIKTVKKLKDDLHSNKISREEAFAEILNDCLKKGNDKNKQATVEELISVLYLNGLSIYADKAKILLGKLSLSSSPPKRTEVMKFNDDGDTETEEEEDSSLQIASSSRTRALSNSLILEEIFKKLSIEDMRNFRLVNSFWWKASLSFWRKSSTVQIKSDGDDYELYAHEHYIHLYHIGIIITDFVKLLQQKEGGNNRIDESNQNRLKLLEPPYRSYRFYFDAFLDIERDFIHREDLEIKREFWESSCGSSMEHLKLSCIHSNGRRIFFKIFKKLVFGVAPNLKGLEFDETCQEAVDAVETEEDEDEDVLPSKPEEEDPASAGKLTEKLESLVLGTNVNAEDTAKILKMCPNLKSLSVRLPNNIDGLLERTGNGEYIKLQKLTVRFSGSRNNDFVLRLRNYVQLLPETLKHVQLTSVPFYSTRRQPDLWAALAQCSSLQSLELELIQEQEESEDEGFRRWFMDLSLFSFPSLLKFKYKTSYYSFDFGTVKGMPKLEELEVEYQPLFFKGRPHPHDEWLYMMGERERFLPPGVTTDYVYLEEDPILLENLKKFSFIGWDISAQDVNLISKWFPHLTALSATISSENLITTVQSWGKLEKLEIHKNDDFIYLSQMRPLKEINKNLRILLHLNILNFRFESRQSMEVMEDEENGGRLFYRRHGTDKYEEYDHYDDDDYVRSRLFDYDNDVEDDDDD